MGEKGVRRGAMLYEVHYSPPQCILGEKYGVSCGPIAYLFTPHAIFLCGEDKYHKYGGGEFIIGGGGGIEYRADNTEG